MHKNRVAMIVVLSALVILINATCSKDRIANPDISDENLSILEVPSAPWGHSELWTEVHPVGDIPTRRGFNVSIYDGRHDKMVIYGGYHGNTFTHDCYALDLATLSWHYIPPPYPTGREGAVAVWDEPNDRMIICGGGHGGAWYRTVYALDLTSETWSLLTPAVDASVPGGVAPARTEAVAIYDPIGQRLILFSGRSSSPVFENDTYALSLDTPGSEVWTRIHPGGAGAPIPRYVAEAIYDPVSHAMIVFGGGAGGPNPLNDIWSFDLTTHTWTELHPTGSIPQPRFPGRQAIYLPSRQWMVVFSGSEGEGGGLIHDMWAFDLRQIKWKEIPLDPVAPLPRTVASFIYDAQRRRAILWAGFSANIPGPPAHSDCWALRF